ncbi:hypothetical protein QBC41DRAFT_398671 [Cercophora samala]|uniref:C3H1-type domain-containing protein n=1 Tax=Cercophora samala TaxID=330535 RepID=A0AA40D917_9PEZI|nr:hypothetical protein QBC41DRAFT_398671 [Cercophora samala]
MCTPLADAKAGFSVNAMSGGKLHQQHPDCKQPRPHWFAGELSSPSVASSGRSPSLTSLESVSSLDSVSESALKTPTAPASWRADPKRTKETAAGTVDSFVNKPGRPHTHHRDSSSSLFTSSGAATLTSSHTISVAKPTPQTGSHFFSGSQSANIHAPNPSVSQVSYIERKRREGDPSDSHGSRVSGCFDAISGVGSGLDIHGEQGRRDPDIFSVNDNSLKASSGLVPSCYSSQAGYKRKSSEGSAVDQGHSYECDLKAHISQQFESVRGVWSSDSVPGLLHDTSGSSPLSQATIPKNIAEIRSKLASAGILASAAPSRSADDPYTSPRPSSPSIGSDTTIKAAAHQLTTCSVQSIDQIPAPCAPVEAASATIETIASAPSTSEALSSVPDPLSGGINISSELVPNLNSNFSFSFGEQQQQQQPQQPQQQQQQNSSKLLEKEEMSGSVAGVLPGGVGAGESSPEGEQMRLSGGVRRGRGQFAASNVGFLGGRARGMLNLFVRLCTDNWRQSAHSPPLPKPGNDTTSSPSLAAVLAPNGNFATGPHQGYNSGFSSPPVPRSPTAASFSSAPAGPAVLSPAARQQFSPFPGPSAAAGVLSPGTPTVSGAGLGFGGFASGSGFSPVGFSGGPSFVDSSGFASLSLSDPFPGQGQLVPAQLAHLRMMGDAGTGNLFSPPTSQPQGMFGFPSSAAGGGPATTPTTTALPATPAPRAQNWNLGQYQTQYLVTIGPDTQGYCFARPDGSRTRLVPVDMLPFSLVGLPATENDNDKLVELVIPAGMDRLCKNSNIDRAMVQSPPSRHQDSIQASSAAAMTGSGPTSPSVAQPRKIKVYCDKWVHEGTCAFTQQGCKYKHEMPMDKATQHSLGLFHGLPSWWKKRQAELSRETERGPLERGGGVSIGGRFAAGGSGGAAGTGAGAGAEGGHRRFGSGWSRWENGSGGSGAGSASDNPPPNFGPVGSERRPGPVRNGEANDEDSERNSVISEGRSVAGMMIISPGRA